MKTLSRESRLLIDAARDGDEPSVDDRRRVRSALARKIAVGAAAGAVAVTATHAATGGVAPRREPRTGGARRRRTAARRRRGAVAGGRSGRRAGGGRSPAASPRAIATGLGAKILVSVAIVGALGAGTVGYARHEAAKRAEEQRTRRLRTRGASSARPTRRCDGNGGAPARGAALPSRTPRAHFGCPRAGAGDLPPHSTSLGE